MFLPQFYRGRRSVLLAFLGGVRLVSTTQDKALSEAIVFLLAHRDARAEHLKIPLPAAN